MPGKYTLVKILSWSRNLILALIIEFFNNIWQVGLKKYNYISIRTLCTGIVDCFVLLEYASVGS